MVDYGLSEDWLNSHGVDLDALAGAFEAIGYGYVGKHRDDEGE